MGRLSWVVGTIYRIVQGCLGDDDIVLSIPELTPELETSIWWTGLLGTTIARVMPSIAMKGKPWQQRAGLLYRVWVALELYPKTPGGN